MSGRDLLRYIGIYAAMTALDIGWLAFKAFVLDWHITADPAASTKNIVIAAMFVIVAAIREPRP